LWTPLRDATPHLPRELDGRRPTVADNTRCSSNESGLREPGLALDKGLISLLSSLASDHHPNKGWENYCM